jgi:hypothetical protein
MPERLFRILIHHTGSSGLFLSVADPGCFSRILDPDFYPSGSRIPDPKTATKERGEKKFVVIPVFVATNFTKLKIILFYLLSFSLLKDYLCKYLKK